MRVSLPMQHRGMRARRALAGEHLARPRSPAAARSPASSGSARPCRARRRCRNIFGSFVKGLPDRDHVARFRHVVHPQYCRPALQARAKPWRGCRRAARSTGRPVILPSVDLRDRPARTGTPSERTRAGASASSGCARRSCRSRSPDRRRCARARCRRASRRVNAFFQKGFDLAPRRRRSAGRAASSPARPSCA